jgi:transketolase
MKKEKGNVYVLLGDGECQEGTLWESLLTASFRKIDNIVAIVDWNKIQGSGFVDDILPIDSLENVAVSCGWEVAIIDGHNNEEILNSLKFPRPEKPYMIIAETVKGKGVSYMENNPKWHANWPDIEHENIAIEELQ